MKGGAKVKSFWHTISELNVFFFGLTQTLNSPGPLREVINRFRTGWASFLVDLFNAATVADIPLHQLRADIEPTNIDGVSIFCLSPEEELQRAFTKAYQRLSVGEAVRHPDPNRLSAILAFLYGSSVVLLGADALKLNWQTAATRYRKHGLPKAVLLKVPHHGASNAFLRHPRPGESNYLDLVAKEGGHAVLFAGDAEHPDGDVYDALRAQTEVRCLSNGTREALPEIDPLRLGVIGGRSAEVPSRICNQVVSFQIDESAKLIVPVGRTCGSC
ncbi:MAG TPA: hypothetical protein VIT00_05310 [Terrimicrobiaceae bacterium]